MDDLSSPDRSRPVSRAQSDASFVTERFGSPHPTRTIAREIDHIKSLISRSASGPGQAQPVGLGSITAQVFRRRTSQEHITQARIFHELDQLKRRVRHEQHQHPPRSADVDPDAESETETDVQEEEVLDERDEELESIREELALVRQQREEWLEAAESRIDTLISEKEGLADLLYDNREKLKLAHSNQETTDKALLEAERKIKALDEQMDNVRDSLDVAKTELESLREARQDTLAALEIERMEKDDLASKLDSVQHALEDVKQQLGVVQEEKERSDLAARAALSRLEDLGRLNAEMASALSESNMRISSLEASKEHEAEHLRNLTEERSDLEHARKREQEEKDALARRLESTESSVAELQKQLETARAEKDGLETAVSDVRMLFADAQTSIVALESTLAEKNEQISTLDSQSRTEIDRLHEVIEERTTTAAHAVVQGREEKEALARQLDTMRSSLDSVQRELGTMTVEKDRIITEASNTRTEKETLAHKLESAQSSLENAQQGLQTLKAENERLGAEAASTRQREAATARRLEVVQSSFAGSRQQLATAQAENGELVAERSSMRTEKDMLLQQIESVQASLKEELQKVESVEAENNALNVEARSVQEDNQALAHNLEHTLSLFKDVKQDLASVVTERDGLRMEVSSFQTLLGEASDVKATLESQLTKKNERLLALDIESKDTAGRLASVNLAYDNSQQQLENVKAEKGKLLMEVSSTQASLQEANGSKANLEATLATTLGKLEAAARFKDETEAALAESNKRISTLEEETKAGVEKLRLSTEEIQRRERALQDAREESERLASEKKDFAEELKAAIEKGVADDLALRLEQEERERLAGEHTSLSSSLDSLQQRLEVADAEKGRLHAQATSTHALLEEATHSKTEVELALAKSNERIVVLEEESRDTTLKLQNAIEEDVASERALEHARAESERLATELTSVRSTLQDAVEASTVSERALAKAQEEGERLAGDLTSTRSSLLDLQTQLRGAESQRDSLDALLASETQAAAERLRSAVDEAAESERALRHARNESVTLAGELASVRSAFSDAEKQLQDTERERDIEVSEKGTLGEQLRNAVNESAASERALEHARSESERLASALSSAEASVEIQLQDMQREKRNSNTLLASTVTQLEAARESSAMVEAALVERNQQIARLEQENEQAAEQLRKLIVEHNSSEQAARNELHHLQEQHDKLSNLWEDEKASHAENRAALATSTERIADLESKNEDAARQLRQTHDEHSARDNARMEELGSLQVRHSALDADRKRLQTRVDELAGQLIEAETAASNSESEHEEQSKRLIAEVEEQKRRFEEAMREVERHELEVREIISDSDLTRLQADELTRERDELSKKLDIATADKEEIGRKAEEQQKSHQSRVQQLLDEHTAARTSLESSSNAIIAEKDMLLRNAAEQREQVTKEHERHINQLNQEHNATLDRLREVSNDEKRAHADEVSKVNLEHDRWSKEVADKHAAAYKALQDSLAAVVAEKNVLARTSSEERTRLIDEHENKVEQLKSEAAATYKALQDTIDNEKSVHAERLDGVNHEHGLHVQALMDDHAGIVKRLQDALGAARAEKEELVHTSETERTRSEEEHQVLVAQLKDEHAAASKVLEESSEQERQAHVGKLEDISRAHDRSIETLTHSHAAESERLQDDAREAEVSHLSMFEKARVEHDSQITAARQELEILREDVQASEAERSRLKAAMEAAGTAHHEELTNIRQEHQSERVRLQGTLEDATVAHLKVLHDARTEHEEKRTRLQTALDDAQASHLKEIEDVRSHLEQQLQSTQEEFAKLKQVATDAREKSQAKLADLAGRLATEAKTGRSLREQLQKGEQSHRERVKDMEASMGEMEANLQEAEQRSHELVSRINEMAAKSDAELMTMENGLVQTREQLSELQKATDRRIADLLHSNEEATEVHSRALQELTSKHHKTLQEYSNRHAAKIERLQSEAAAATKQAWREQDGAISALNQAHREATEAARSEADAKLEEAADQAAKVARQLQADHEQAFASAAQESERQQHAAVENARVEAEQRLSFIVKDHENEVNKLRQQIEALEETHQTVNTQSSRAHEAALTQLLATHDKEREESARDFKAQFDNVQANHMSVLQGLRNEHQSGADKARKIHERIIEELVAKHDNERKISTADARAQLDDLLSSHASALQALQNDTQIATEEAVRSHESAIAGLTATYASERETLAANAKAQLEELQSGNMSALQALRDGHQLELEKTNENHKATIAELTDKYEKAKVVASSEAEKRLEDSQATHISEMTTLRQELEAVAFKAAEAHKSAVEESLRERDAADQEMQKDLQNLRSNHDSSLAAVREEHRIALDEASKNYEAVTVRLKAEHHDAKEAASLVAAERLEELRSGQAAAIAQLRGEHGRTIEELELVNTRALTAAEDRYKSLETSHAAILAEMVTQHKNEQDQISSNAQKQIEDLRSGHASDLAEVKAEGEEAAKVLSGTHAQALTQVEDRCKEMQDSHISMLTNTLAKHAGEQEAAAQEAKRQVEELRSRHALDLIDGEAKHNRSTEETAASHSQALSEAEARFTVANDTYTATLAEIAAKHAAVQEAAAAEAREQIEDLRSRHASDLATTQGEYLEIMERLGAAHERALEEEELEYTTRENAHKATLESTRQKHSEQLAQLRREHQERLGAQHATDIATLEDAAKQLAEAREHHETKLKALTADHDDTNSALQSELTTARTSLEAITTSTNEQMARLKAEHEDHVRELDVGWSSKAAEAATSHEADMRRLADKASDAHEDFEKRLAEHNATAEARIATARQSHEAEFAKAREIHAADIAKVREIVDAGRAELLSAHAEHDRALARTEETFSGQVISMNLTHKAEIQRVVGKHDDELQRAQEAHEIAMSELNSAQSNCQSQVQDLRNQLDRAAVDSQAQHDDIRQAHAREVIELEQEARQSRSTFEAKIERMLAEHEQQLQAAYDNIDSTRSDLLRKHEAAINDDRASAASQLQVVTEDHLKEIAAIEQQGRDALVQAQAEYRDQLTTLDSEMKVALHVQKQVLESNIAVMEANSNVETARVQSLHDETVQAAEVAKESELTALRQAHRHDLNEAKRGQDELSSEARQTQQREMEDLRTLQEAELERIHHSQAQALAGRDAEWSAKLAILKEEQTRVLSETLEKSEVSTLDKLRELEQQHVDSVRMAIEAARLELEQRLSQAEGQHQQTMHTALDKIRHANQAETDTLVDRHNTTLATCKEAEAHSQAHISELEKGHTIALAAVVADANTDTDNKLRAQAATHEDEMLELRQDFTAKFSMLQTELEQLSILHENEKERADEEREHATAAIVAKLEAAELEAADITTKNDLLNSLTNDLQARLSAEVATHTEAERSLASMRKDKADEVAQAAESTEALRAQIAEQQEHIDSLTRQHDEATVTLRELQERSSSSDADRTTSRLSEELITLQQRLSLAEQESREARAFVQQKLEEKSDLARQTADLMEEIERLKAAQLSTLAHPASDRRDAEVQTDPSTLVPHSSQLRGNHASQAPVPVDSLREEFESPQVNGSRRLRTVDAYSLFPEQKSDIMTLRSSKGKERASPRPVTPASPLQRLTGQGKDRVRKQGSFEDYLQHAQTELAELGSVITANEMLFAQKIQEHVGELQRAKDHIAAEYKAKFDALNKQREDMESDATSKGAADFARDRNQLAAKFGVEGEESGAQTALLTSLPLPQAKALRSAEERLVSEYTRRIATRKSQIALKHAQSFQALTQDYDEKIVGLLNDKERLEGDLSVEPERFEQDLDELETMSVQLEADKASSVHNSPQPQRRYLDANDVSPSPAVGRTLSGAGNRVTRPPLPQSSLTGRPRTPVQIPRAVPFPGSRNSLEATSQPRSSDASREGRRSISERYPPMPQRSLLRARDPPDGPLPRRVVTTPPMSDMWATPESVREGASQNFAVDPLAYEQQTLQMGTPRPSTEVPKTPRTSEPSRPRTSEPSRPRSLRPGSGSIYWSAPRHRQG